MWQEMYNVSTVYKDEDFKLSTEEVEGELFVHLKLETFSRSILDKVLKQFAKVKAKAYWDGRDAIYTYTKDDRMFKLFSFEPMGEVVYYKEKYKVGKWALKSF